MKNKGKNQNTSPLPPSFQAQLHFFIPNSSASSFLSSTGRMKRCSQLTTVPLWHSFLLTVFPCSSMSPSPRLQSFKDCFCMGSSPQAAVPVRSLLPCGFSRTEPFFRAYPLAKEWSSPQAAGKYLKAPPPSPSLTLVSAGLFLLTHTHTLLNSNLSFS